MNDITKALDSLHTLTDEEQAQVLQELTGNPHHRTQNVPQTIKPR